MPVIAAAAMPLPTSVAAPHHYLLSSAYFASFSFQLPTLRAGGGGGAAVVAGRFVVRMGGGPRTYPGGVSKWQWKRMQSKKAKQLLKARLARERQIYEMRKRAELRAAVAGLERPWEEVARPPPVLMSVAADEQVKVLADRFLRPGGVDLWNDRDGPAVFRPPEGMSSVRFFPPGAVHSVKPYTVGTTSGGKEDESAGPSRRRRRRKNYSEGDGSVPGVPEARAQGVCENVAPKEDIKIVRKDHALRSKNSIDDRGKKHTHKSNANIVADALQNWRNGNSARERPIVGSRWNSTIPGADMSSSGMISKPTKQAVWDYVDSSDIQLDSLSSSTIDDGMNDDAWSVADANYDSELHKIGFLDDESSFGGINEYDEFEDAVADSDEIRMGLMHYGHPVSELDGVRARQRTPAKVDTELELDRDRRSSMPRRSHFRSDYSVQKQRESRNSWKQGSSVNSSAKADIRFWKNLNPASALQQARGRLEK